MADSAVDNDVVFKSVCYGFFSELIDALPGQAPSPGILGTARFVLPKLMRKRPPQREQAADDLAAVLQGLETLEPTPDETALAAELELAAQQQALPMHAGECQLVAILFLRDLRFLLSGDRSAIDAMARFTPPNIVELQALEGKFICFEQAIRFLTMARGASWVRNAVCGEREVDTALRVCFSCSSPEVGEDSWMEGLHSHIESLREQVGALLMT